MLHHRGVLQHRGMPQQSDASAGECSSTEGCPSRWSSSAEECPSTEERAQGADLELEVVEAGVDHGLELRVVRCPGKSRAG